MEEETHQTSENMRKFFENLSNLKNFISEKADETGDGIIIEIRDRLDKIFKVRDGK